MPPPIKRDDCVIVFDLNVSSDFFRKARECLLDIYGNKWCSESRDCVCLLPYGETNTTHWKGDFYNYDPLDVKKTVTTVEKNDGRISSALLHAVRFLEQRHYGGVTSKGLYTRQLVCISDFSKSSFSDRNENDAFKELVEKLNGIKAFLYIFGPEVAQSSDGQVLMDWRDLRKWIENPVFVKAEQNENLKVVRRLVEAVDRSVVCDLWMAPSILGYFKRWAGPQPCIIPLTLGDNKMQFTNRDLRCLRRMSFMKFQGDPDMYSRPFVLATNPEVEVDRENMVRGMLIGDKVITMSQEVRNAFKTKGERSFDLLGFTERSLVQAHLFVGDGTHRTIPAGLWEEWTVGLMRVLKEKDLVGIAAKRVIRNTRAKFWALIPSDNCRWFYVVQLPFGNHMRKKYFAKKPDPNSNLDYLLHSDDDKPSTSAQALAHQEEIYQYLDSMEITGDDLPINVTMSRNPQFKRWWRFCVEKYSGLETNWAEEEMLGKRTVSDEPLRGFWKERTMQEQVPVTVDADDKDTEN